MSRLHRLRTILGKGYEPDRSVGEYVDWCSRWLVEIARLTKLVGALWLNLGYLSMPPRARALPIAYLLWDRVPMYLIQEIVWHYGAGVAAQRGVSPRNEKFLWYVKSPDCYKFYLDRVRDPDVKYPHQKKNGKLKCNPLGKNPSDVWHFAKLTSGRDRSSKERTPHPAQFPLAVIERVTLACCDPEDILFDPFIGSGTVAVAAARLGRSAVGFEIRSDYLELAAARLDADFSDRAAGQGVEPLHADRH